MIIVETNLPEVIARQEAAITKIPLSLTMGLTRTAEESKAVLVPEIAAHTPYDASHEGTHLSQTTVGEVAVNGLTAEITARQTKMVYWRKKGMNYPLARLLIEGTDPHEITAPPGHALFWLGAEHPVKKVQHPGTEPDDYPKEGLAAAMPAITVILRHGGELIAESVAASMAGL